MTSLSLINGGDSIRVRIPMKMKRRGGRKEIIVPDGLEDAQASDPDYHKALVLAISRAHRWKELLDRGKYRSIREMAAEFGIAHPYVARIMRLTLLAPDIVETILDGGEPDGLSLEQLRRPVSVLWHEQRQSLRTE